MTGDRSRLRNFVKKFIGTVRFGNDHFGAIMGYGDYVIGESSDFQGLYYVGRMGHKFVFCRSFMSRSRKLPSEAFLITFKIRWPPYVPPTNKDLEILFQPMFDEYLEPPRVERPVSPAPVVQVPVNSTGTPSSTTIDQVAPSPSHSPLSSALQSPSLHQGVAAESTLIEDNSFAPIDNDPFINVFAPDPRSEASSSGDLSSTKSPYVSQTVHHLGK
ncbi:hypothetical protein Tco_0199379 [Tanacetum coccineum]